MSIREDRIDKFLRLSSSHRRNIRLATTSVLRKRLPPSPVLTRDEIIDVLQRNGIKSFRQLNKARILDSSLPSFYRVKQVFGSWKEVKIASSMVPLIVNPIKKTDEQIIQLIVKYTVSSITGYLRHRKSQPELFPSAYEIRLRFGSWENLKRLACGRQLRNVLERYIVLKQQIGRWPTNDECEKAGVEIHFLLKYLPRKQLREWVVTLEGKT